MWYSVRARRAIARPRPNHDRGGEEGRTDKSERPALGAAGFFRYNDHLAVFHGSKNLRLYSWRVNKKAPPRTYSGEKTAIDCASATCERLHTEAVRAIGLDEVVVKCNRFLSIMSLPHPYDWNCPRRSRVVGCPLHNEGE